MKRNLEIYACLENGNLEKLSDKEIVDWVFSEAQSYHAENASFKKDQGFGIPYTGHTKDGSATSFGGALGLWVRDYTPQNKNRMVKIAKKIIDKITENYESFIKEDYLNEITTSIRCLEIYDEKLKESLETLYKKVLKDKDKIKGVFKDISLLLEEIDFQNSEKYLSERIKNLEEIFKKGGKFLDSKGNEVKAEPIGDLENFSEMDLRTYLRKEIFHDELEFWAENRDKRYSEVNAYLIGECFKTESEKLFPIQFYKI